jgi:hypothetical protein
MTVSVGADADGLLPGRHGGPSLIEEKDAYGPRNRHSDQEKFRNDLNGPKSCEMSERLLKTLRKSGDFQAEYEGSIPFTRSILDLILTTVNVIRANRLNTSPNLLLSSVS